MLILDIEMFAVVCKEIIFKCAGYLYQKAGIYVIFSVYFVNMRPSTVDPVSEFLGTHSLFRGNSADMFSDMYHNWR